MIKNNVDLLLSTELMDFHIYRDFIDGVPDFGLWHLTVKDAAALIATDLWFQGGISVKVKKADSYEPGDPKLQKSLSKHCEEFEKRLTAAIDKGSLRAVKIHRDLKENLHTGITLIDYDCLARWLVERGHAFGEAFEHYSNQEVEIHHRVLDEIYLMRMMNKPNALPFMNASETGENSDRAGVNELRANVSELITENIKLTLKNKKLEEKLHGVRESSPKKKERPLSTRERRTLLTIIAALCSKAKIDYHDHGVAIRISKLTEEIGAVVSDDTIRQIIKEVDDAVQTRSK